jgi:hypothetical protein
LVERFFDDLREADFFFGTIAASLASLGQPDRDRLLAAL